MEIAALPSCEKSLFAGAKVAFFLKKREPSTFNANTPTIRHWTAGV